VIAAVIAVTPVIQIAGRKKRKERRRKTGMTEGRREMRQSLKIEETVEGESQGRERRKRERQLVLKLRRKKILQRGEKDVIDMTVNGRIQGQEENLKGEARVDLEVEGGEDQILKDEEKGVVQEPPKEGMGDHVIERDQVLNVGDVKIGPDLEIDMKEETDQFQWRIGDADDLLYLLE